MKASQKWEAFLWFLNHGVHGGRKSYILLYIQISPFQGFNSEYQIAIPIIISPLLRFNNNCTPEIIIAK